MSRNSWSDLWMAVAAIAIAFAIGASPLTDDNPALGILLIGLSVALLVLVAASVVRRRRLRSRTTRRAHSRC